MGGARTGLAEGVGQLQGSCETSLHVRLAVGKEEGPRVAGQCRDVLVRVLDFLLAYLMRGGQQVNGGGARQPGGRAGPNRAHQGQGRRVRAARAAGALAWRARRAARTRVGPAACQSGCGRSPTVCRALQTVCRAGRAGGVGGAAAAARGGEPGWHQFHMAILCCVCRIRRCVFRPAVCVFSPPQARSTPCVGRRFPVLALAFRARPRRATPSACGYEFGGRARRPPPRSRGQAPAPFHDPAPCVQAWRDCHNAAAERRPAWLGACVAWAGVYVTGRLGRLGIVHLPVAGERGPV